MVAFLVGPAARRLSPLLILLVGFALSAGLTLLSAHSYHVTLNSEGGG